MRQFSFVLISFRWLPVCLSSFWVCFSIVAVRRAVSGTLCLFLSVLSQFRSISTPFRSVSTPFRSVSVRFKLVSVRFKSVSVFLGTRIGIFKMPIRLENGKSWKVASYLKYIYYLKLLFMIFNICLEYYELIVTMLNKTTYIATWFY